MSNPIINPSAISPDKYYAPYVPLAQAYPVLQGAAIEVPAAFEVSPLSPEMWYILQNAKTMTIRQHVKLLPKSCCVCPPCVKQENTYSVYAGLNNMANDAEFLRIDEVSDDWNRCCCSPYHPLRLEVRQYIPFPGDNSSSDYSHLSEDIRTDFSRFRGREQQQYMRNFYMSQPVLMSMVRDDGERCCWKCPCKLLSSFVCFDFCKDGMHLYAGPVVDEPEKEKGRPFQLDQSKLIGSAVQPLYGGWTLPTIHLRADGQQDSDVPFGKVEGPCFFGGWSEMCCDFKFYTSYFNSPTHAGDLAFITKKKPQSLAGAFTELMTNSDVYTIQFNEKASLTAGQKATILTAQILADYMFFDGNTEKCKDTDGAVICYCCYFSCVGKLCPCYVAIPKNAG
eukprot:gene16529-22562_t